MDEKNSEDSQNWTRPQAESNLAVRGIISKLDKHVVLLLINYIASQLLGVAQSEDITRWREDMNFMFEWQELYLTSECTTRT